MNETKIPTLTELIFSRYPLSERVFRALSKTEERATNNNSLHPERSWKSFLRRQHWVWVLKNE